MGVTWALLAQNGGTSTVSVWWVIGTAIALAVVIVGSSQWQYSRIDRRIERVEDRVAVVDEKTGSIANELARLRGRIESGASVVSAAEDPLGTHREREDDDISVPGVPWSIRPLLRRELARAYWSYAVTVDPEVRHELRDLLLDWERQVEPEDGD